MSFIPLAGELGIGVPPFGVGVPAGGLDTGPLGGEDTGLLGGEDTGLLGGEDTGPLGGGEGLFGLTAGQVRLKSGSVLSWEPTMPKLGVGVVG